MWFFTIINEVDEIGIIELIREALINLIIFLVCYKL